MGKPHPVELRARVVGFVDEGHSHRKAARHFRVSPKFVNDMMELGQVSMQLGRWRRRGGEFFCHIYLYYIEINEFYFKSIARPTHSPTLCMRFGLC